MSFKQVVMAVSLLLVANSVSAEAGLDMSKPLVCAATQVVECPMASDCTRATPETFNLPVLFRIDMANKVVESARAGGENRVSAIASVTEAEGVSVLHGVDGTAGWNMTIDQSSGQMTLASARPGVTHTVFGTCATL
jgi:hypothetical protein